MLLVDVVCLCGGGGPPSLPGPQDPPRAESLPVGGHQPLVSQLLDLREVCGRETPLRFR